MRAPLCLAALALAPAAAAWPVRASRVAVATAPRAASANLAPPLPANPWRELRRVDLPAPCGQPVVALPGGGLAVGLDAPPGVAFVARDGETLTVARLPHRVTQPLAVAPDGRVLAVAGLHVYAVAPDGTVRASASLAAHAIGAALVRGDGTAVVAASSNSAGVEFAQLTAGGELASSLSLTARPLTPPALLPDGRVAVGTPNALVTVDARGRHERLPAMPGLRLVTSRDDGALVMAADNALLVADERGAVRARVALPDAPLWASALGGGRVAVAVAGSVNQLWVVERDGAVSSRTPVPPGTAPPLVDPSGALVVPSRGGDLVAIDRGGAERWRVTLHETLRPPAVALPRGGVAVATEGSALLIVTDGP